jgi:hypothetical protein
MPEVPHARQDHCQALVVSGLDDLRVAHGAARLNDGGGSGFGSREQTVGEWEEGIRGND